MGRGVSRDLRIDFLRGLVLLLIVADHVFFNETRWFALSEWVYWDGAAGFVFMSGLVCGMVYSRVLARDGLGAAQKKAIGRSVQLYAAQIAMLAAVCGLLALAGRWIAVNPRPLGLKPMVDSPGKALPLALGMAYQPWLMDILRLYMMFLLVLPGALWLYRRNRLLAIALSATLYGFAQKYPDWTLRDVFDRTAWFWNPLAWQALFFGAAALGAEIRCGRLRLPRNRFWPVAALLVLIASVILCRNHVLPWMWTDREKLAPAHIVGFAAFAFLLASLLQRDWPFWSTPLAQAVIRCGRNSLPVFCVGVVLDYGVSMLLAASQDPVVESMLVAAAVGLTLAFGNGLDWVIRGRKGVAAAAAPQPEIVIVPEAATAAFAPASRLQHPGAPAASARPVALSEV